jgi:hypothetical protein
MMRQYIVDSTFTKLNLALPSECTAEEAWPRTSPSRRVHKGEMRSEGA